jgi:hypothetical protein
MSQENVDVVVSAAEEWNFGDDTGALEAVGEIASGRERLPADPGLPHRFPTAARGPLYGPRLGSGISASDGTRTRDLRRDRPAL